MSSESRFFARSLTEVKQQELKHLQPILTPVVIIILLLSVAIVFMPIGFVLLDASENIVQHRQRYDNLEDCKIKNSDNFTSGQWPRECNVSFTLKDDMDAPVHFFYELHNYHQNHRRYLKSKDDDQLQGDVTDVTLCDPVKKYQSTKLYPCGLVAATFFNDRFRMNYDGQDFCNTTHRCKNWGPANESAWMEHWDEWSEGPDWSIARIAWDTDEEDKFEFKDASKHDVTQQGKRQVKAGLRLPDANNHDLIVWMKPAALPKFRKLHRIIKDTDLKKGKEVTVTVLNWFPVDHLDAQKWFVLSTATWAGGKNYFLAWTYISVSIVAIVLAVTFAILLLVGQRSVKSSIQITNGSVMWT